MKSRKSIVFVILKCLIALIALAAVCFAALLGFLSVTEFKPAEVQPLTVSGSAAKSLKSGEPVKVISWNIGYGALGDNADFFMDGGKMVQTADTQRVNENMNEILRVLKEQDADLVLLQESDVNSSRSHHIDETKMVADALPGRVCTFANNFKVAFVPYPVPPIGKVDSGLFTLSAYPVGEAQRVRLPNPFSWPIRMANLKRCLAVHRIPVEGSGRELVLVNLHLEAYDDGEGKVAQTKILMEFLESEISAGNYVIAGGDFNQTFSTADLSRFPVRDDVWKPGAIDVSGFTQGWQFLMDTNVPSCRSLDSVYAGADPESFQYYVIDGYILSGNIDVVSFETLQENFAATDHNPVLLEVVLQDPGQ